ncbi:MAG: hypothetical protein K2J44_05515, partial [Ruminococcus sp.]|nr:hypothetical protein [Ruminococcus sp.]
YGVDVAKLAGLPPKVVSRAREFLEEMEQNHNSSINSVKHEESGQISFESINRETAFDMLRKTNVDELTDSECRMLLNDVLELIKH